MAASTASAALNGTLLVAAVFLVLLGSSMAGPPHHCPDDHAGQHPAAPALRCRDDDSDEQPAPTPAPAASPTPTAPPPPPRTPSPAPAVDPQCYLNCTTQCSPQCQAEKAAGTQRCQDAALAVANSCYDTCTANTCPDKCVNSGCSNMMNCTCDNTYALSCCDVCRQGLINSFGSCAGYYERLIKDCIGSCWQVVCTNKCTQS